MKLPKLFWQATDRLWDIAQGLLGPDLSEFELPRDPESVPFGEDWTWLVPSSGHPGVPIYFPDDMMDEALAAVSNETTEQARAMQEQQWWWKVNAMGVRHIIAIAHQEPDAEVALMMWAAFAGAPKQQ